MGAKVRDLNRLKSLANAAKAKETSGSDPYWQGYYSHTRHPMLLTTKQWLKKNRYIILHVNPKEMSWSLPRRESVSKTAAGAIRNTWRNRFRGTYYDEGSLSVTFQTGNLLPGAGIPEELFGFRDTFTQQYSVANRYAPTDRDSRVSFSREVNQRRGENADAVAEIMRNPPVPAGLQNFYDFLEMVDQPMLSSSAGGENRHIILYRSRVFPMLRLSGYFTGDPITFSESAEGNANKLEWQATFQIYRSSPPWWQADSLRAAYVDAIRTYGGMSEIYPAGFNPAEFQDWLKTRQTGDLSDPNIPYQKVSSKSAKKPGLVDKKGKPVNPGTSTSASPQTGVKAGQKQQAPEETTKDRVDGLKDFLIGVKGKNTTQNFFQTAKGQKLAKMLDNLPNFFEKDKPATEAEVKKLVNTWLKSNLTKEEQAQWSGLLDVTK